MEVHEIKFAFAGNFYFRRILDTKLAEFHENLKM